MKLPVMPRNLFRLGKGEKFGFVCDKTVPCFTHCCRKLELALTPYDVLRVKNGLGVESSLFLEKYVLVEYDEKQDVFPRLYLTMIDNDEESCVFVTPQGCSIYADRPGACRAYPMGRASMRGDADTLNEYYVLLKEDHCKGFTTADDLTAEDYSAGQGLLKYNEMNDALAAILQHEKIRQGMRLSQAQIELYILALYDIDTFRKKLFSKALLDDERVACLQKELQDDERLLLFAIQWLYRRLFGEELPT